MMCCADAGHAAVSKCEGLLQALKELLHRYANNTDIFKSICTLLRHVADDSRTFWMQSLLILC